VWAEFLNRVTQECKTMLGDVHWKHLRDEAFSIRSK
jgi:hypothetical protein